MSRKKILLVDDSNTILMMERMILTKGPYDLVTATNGEEAVVKAVSERPDLILMDVVMPRRENSSASRRRRADASPEPAARDRRSQTPRARHRAPLHRERRPTSRGRARHPSAACERCG